MATHPNQVVLSINLNGHLPTVENRRLEGAKLYVGQVNKDPREYRTDVYLDSGMTIASPPYLTIKNGYMWYEGDIVELYTTEPKISMLLLDTYGRQLFYLSEMTTAIVCEVPDTDSGEGESGDSDSDDGSGDSGGGGNGGGGIANVLHEDCAIYTDFTNPNISYSVGGMLSVNQSYQHDARVYGNISMFMGFTEDEMIEKGRNKEIIAVNGFQIQVEYFYIKTNYTTGEQFTKFKFKLIQRASPTMYIQLPIKVRIGNCERQGFINLNCKTYAIKKYSIRDDAAPDLSNKTYSSLQEAFDAALENFKTTHEMVDLYTSGGLVYSSVAKEIRLDKYVTSDFTNIFISRDEFPDEVIYSYSEDEDSTTEVNRIEDFEQLSKNGLIMNNYPGFRASFGFGLSYFIKWKNDKGDITSKTVNMSIFVESDFPDF